MQTETLLDRTFRLLSAATDLTYREIAEGASVDMNWLAKLKQGQIGEPGVHKIQRVHDFLIGRLPPDQQALIESDPIHSQSLGNAGNG